MTKETLGPPVDLWDTDWPTGRYYWTVVPVAMVVKTDGDTGAGRIEYDDLDVPQDTCAAGTVASFGKTAPADARVERQRAVRVGPLAERLAGLAVEAEAGLLRKPARLVGARTRCERLRGAVEQGALAVRHRGQADPHVRHVGAAAAQAGHVVVPRPRPEPRVARRRPRDGVVERRAADRRDTDVQDRRLGLTCGTRART